MPQQPAKPGVRALEALGLTIFVATAAFLTALFFSGLGSVFASLQRAAVSFSTLCAAVAVVAMLLDAADLWVRGRKMPPHRVKLFRWVVFAAVFGALAASLLGGNSLVIVFLAPSMIVYLFIARRRLAGPYATATGTARGGSGSSGSRSGSSSGKTRQRKGGKKHR